MCFLIGTSSYLYKVDISTKPLFLISAFLFAALLVSRKPFLIGMFIAAISSWIGSVLGERIFSDNELWYSVYLAFASFVWFIGTLIISRRKPKKPNTPDKEKTK